MPADTQYTRDIAWVYDNLHAITVRSDDGTITIDASRATSPMPGPSAIGVAEWAAEHRKDFFQRAHQILGPSAGQDEGDDAEDDGDGHRFIRSKVTVQRIDEILATVTELHGVESVSQAIADQMLATRLRRASLRVAHFFQVRLDEQRKAVAKWRGQQNSSAVAVAEAVLIALESLATQLQECLEDIGGTSQQQSAAAVAGGQPDVPPRTQSVGQPLG